MLQTLESCYNNIWVEVTCLPNNSENICGRIRNILVELARNVMCMIPTSNINGEYEKSAG